MIGHRKESDMIGETDLSRLLAGARPILDPATYVFITTETNVVLSHQAVIGTFREAEGLTLIAERRWAESQGMNFIFPCRRITLTIHSSLEAVGLMAAVSDALAKAGISTNPVSAFYHDHLFVPEADADRALELLQTLVPAAHGSVAPARSLVQGHSVRPARREVDSAE
jgi:hypothetical protein